MEIEVKKYLSANKLSKVYGIPNNMIRKDIRTGKCPGFFSGSWFYIDVPAYLQVLNERGNKQCLHEYAGKITSYIAN